MPRLLIYWIEAQAKPEPARQIVTNQMKLMAYRLWYIITWPSAVLATLFALVLLILMPAWLTQSWMWVKLGFVVLLLAYHLRTHQLFRQLQAGHYRFTATFMRIWNEGATLILFAVVFLVILKSSFHWIFGVVGLLALALLLMLGIRLYKRYRKN